MVRAHTFVARMKLYVTPLLNLMRKEGSSFFEGQVTQKLSQAIGAFWIKEH